MERGMLLLLCVADTVSVCKVMNIFSGKMDFKKIFVVYQCDKSDSDRTLQAPGVSEGQEPGVLQSMGSQQVRYS